MKRMIAAALVCAVLCALCACGKKEKEKPASSEPMQVKVGALFADSASSTSFSHFHKLGLEKAAEALELDEPVCKYNVTDVSFDPDTSVTATSAAESESTDPPEPESYTTEDGEVIVRGIPVETPTPESAVSAAADLIDQGCSVIVATDPVYDELTAFLAEQFNDVIFLQYRGTHTDLPNLQSFSENAYEAFYLAGAVAGCENIKRIGFTARTGSREEIDCINAFALGAAKYCTDAEVIVRLTHVDLDLELERSLTLALVEKDECKLLAQSVFTALPATVAAGTDAGYKHAPLPCVGYGYDMMADGGSKYLCSVVFDFSAYYRAAFKALADGSFDASPYAGGVREGIVKLSALQHASEKAKTTLVALKEEYKNGTLHPLEGFKPAKNGYASNVTIR